MPHVPSHPDTAANFPGLAHETTILVLPCAFVDETLDFFQALGFTVTYRMTRPYLYLALRWREVELHFGRPPKAGFDPANEDNGGCLVLVDQVAPYHAQFTAAMRTRYGKVLARGRPRLTRYRPGATRFTLVDPSGNAIIFIQRDEPVELEYGGSAQLAPLAKALDNARILRDFRGDDSAAAAVIATALGKFGDTAPAIDRARAYAALLELASAPGGRGDVHELLAQLRTIPLTEAERAQFGDEFAHVELVASWLASPDQQ